MGWPLFRGGGLIVLGGGLSHPSPGLGTSLSLLERERNQWNEDVFSVCKALLKWHDRRGTVLQRWRGLDGNVRLSQYEFIVYSYLTLKNVVPRALLKVIGNDIIRQIAYEFFRCDYGNILCRFRDKAITSLFSHHLYVIGPWEKVENGCHFCDVFFKTELDR